MLSLESLLPLRSAILTLRFGGASSPAFFHQPALGAFLRHLAGGAENFDRLVRFDAPESGRIAYAPGQHYRFQLIGLGGGENLLRDLLNKLARLPEASPKNDPRLPFRDNWRVVAVHDAFTARPVHAFEELSVYDEAAMAREAEFWRGRDIWIWRFLAPARLLKDKAKRGLAKGEARYCRNLADLDGPLLASRLRDSLAELLKSRGIAAPPRPSAPEMEIADGHAFWLDAAYLDAQGQEHVMGGMNGRLRLRFPEPPPESWLRQAILGQYAGMGQRVAFGFGRYRLETPDGEFTLPRASPAASLLTLAREESNLIEAWRHIRRRSRRRARMERRRSLGRNRCGRARRGERGHFPGAFASRPRSRFDRRLPPAALARTSSAQIRRRSAPFGRAAFVRSRLAARRGANPDACPGSGPVSAQLRLSPRAFAARRARRRASRQPRRL